MDSKTVEQIQKDLLSAFETVSNGVNNTISGISRFAETAKPYMNFFFSNESTEKTFLSDTVKPSEKSLSAAIESAIRIMNSDSTAHSEVRSSLENVRTMQESVSNIVEMLDHIETYSLNTIVVSARAGEDGHALSTISSEMARLSQSGSSLSENITGQMNDLIESLNRFDMMGAKIELLHENNLTTIKLSSDLIFKRLHSDFTEISGKISEEYKTLQSVVKKMGFIKEKFQHEDIVRQNIEKIMFALQESENPTGESALKEYDGGEILKMLARVKLSDIRDDIDIMRKEISTALNDVHECIDDISLSLEYGERKSNSEDNISAIAALYDRLTGLVKSFTDYITLITQEKNDMLVFLSSVQTDIQKFESFFDEITAISKKFKTVILLTSIEMARHDSLKYLLGGSLTDVRQIPDRITRIVDEGKLRYAELTSVLNTSIRSYRERYNEQKIVLSDSGKTIREIAERIRESETVHNDFVKNTEDKIAEARSIIESTSACLNTFSEKGEILAREMESLPSADRNTLLVDFADPLDRMRAEYGDSTRSGDYRSMMLASLAGEFKTTRDNIQTVEFF